MENKPPTPDEQAGMDWWNSLSKADRASWLMVANSAVPADAYRAYLCSQKANELSTNQDGSAK